MVTKIQLGSIEADVILKDIKNVHLSVHPPTGRVRIAAPSRMKLDTIRVFAISKLGWIKRQQQKLIEQPRETPREFLERESHYVWGKRHLLSIVEADAKPSIVLTPRKMILTIRPGADVAKRRDILEYWYRDQVRRFALPLIERWETVLGVTVDRFFVQRMRTRWGSCNPKTASIRLNTDLAKKPRQCLEYVVLHEMLHLLEPTHNDRFVSLLNKYFPNWRQLKAELNELPLTADSWDR